MQDTSDLSSPDGEERSRLSKWRAAGRKVLRWVPTVILPVSSGLGGLGSLWLPWVLAIGGGGWYDRISMSRILGVDLLFSSYLGVRPAVLLLVVGSLLCIVTGFLTRKPERRHFRSLLYGFYTFLGALAILDVEAWVATPRISVIGFGVVMFSEVGVRAATYAVIGMAVTAFAAFLEKRPGRPSVSSLVIGVPSGVSTLYTFFNVGWVFRSWSSYSGPSFSGFDLAFYHFQYLDWLGPSVRDPAWRLLQVYFTSLFFYMVPVLAVLAMMLPFMKAKQNIKVPLERAFYSFIGAALLLMGFFVSISASGFVIGQGPIFLMAIGTFLVVSQSAMHVHRRVSSREPRLTSQNPSAPAIGSPLDLLLFSTRSGLRRNDGVRLEETFVRTDSWIDCGTRSCRCLVNLRLRNV